MYGTMPFISNINMPIFNPYIFMQPFPMQYLPMYNFSSLFEFNLPLNYTISPFNNLNNIFNCNYTFSPFNMAPIFSTNSYPKAQKTSTPADTNPKKQSYSTTKLFDKNTKLSIKTVTKGAMPYLLIGPENVDPNEKLPVLVSLHGLYQRGSNPDLLQSKEYDPAVIMKDWNLKNFRGYILCPQLQAGGSWCRKGTEQKVRNLLKEFQSTHNVDKDNISLIGFSLGGAGALYLANEMSDVFKKAVTLSPYEPGNLGTKMKIPTKAYAGGKDDSRAGGPIKMTQGKLKNILGTENCKIIPEKTHGQLPRAVFCIDDDKNGCSDVIEWLFS